MKRDYKCIIDSAKREFFKNKLNNLDCTRKQKFIWKIVRRKNGKIKENNINKLRVDSIVVSSNELIANSFAKQFSECVDIALNEHFGVNVSYDCTANICNNNSFFYEPATTEEVLKVISGLKDTSAVGVDCLSTAIIKSIADLIAEPLTYIFNSSVEAGIFPDKLKIGTIIPVFKRGDDLDICNYRPITILNVISKIFERIVYK